MRIAILKADAVREELREEFGEYPFMFEQLLRSVDPSVSVDSFDVRLGEYPPSMEEYDGSLITGSRHSVYEDIPWIHDLMSFVQVAHEKKRKLVGICFGHQVIAQALGGNVAKSDKGWGIGVHQTKVCPGAAFVPADAAQQIRLICSHQDQVESLPEDAQRIGGSDFCEFGIFQVGEHLLSFQGHPEFTPGYAVGLMERRRILYDDELYETALSSFEAGHDGQAAAKWILNFIKG